MGMWAMYTPFPPKKSELLDRLVAPQKKQTELPNLVS